MVAPRDRTRHARTRAGVGRGLARSESAGYLDAALTNIGEQIEVHPLGCWLWTGTCDERGYGRTFQLLAPVHRVVYETLVGPIPAGHHLHHRCGTRRCCNPRHLTPMDPGDHSAHHAAVRKLA